MIRAGASCQRARVRSVGRIRRAGAAARTGAAHTELIRGPNLLPGESRLAAPLRRRHTGARSGDEVQSGAAWPGPENRTAWPSRSGSGGDRAGSKAAGRGGGTNRGRGRGGGAGTRRSRGRGRGRGQGASDAGPGRREGGKGDSRPDAPAGGDASTREAAAMVARLRSGPGTGGRSGAGSSGAGRASQSTAEAEAEAGSAGAAAAEAEGGAAQPQGRASLFANLAAGRPQPAGQQGTPRAGNEGAQSMLDRVRQLSAARSSSGPPEPAREAPPLSDVLARFGPRAVSGSEGLASAQPRGFGSSFGSAVAPEGEASERAASSLLHILRARTSSGAGAGADADAAGTALGEQTMEKFQLVRDELEQQRLVRDMMGEERVRPVGSWGSNRNPYWGGADDADAEIAASLYDSEEGGEEAARQARQERRAARRQAARPTVHLPGSVPLTVQDMAAAMGVLDTAALVERVLEFGEDVEGEDSRVSTDVAELVIESFGMVPHIKTPPDDEQPTVVEDASVFPPRAPTVAVLGHVDHGKTTLLDVLRGSNRTAGEAGGITQSLAAFDVLVGGEKRVTFLDTPGHAAFMGMRQRGAATTDIGVLVVAADDGVMAQTRESIRHAAAAGTQLVVAVTKCDKVDDVSEAVGRVSEQLEKEGVIVEPRGGDVPLVPVSAARGDGVEDLKELLALQADVLEIGADPSCRGEATVLEARVDRGLGNTTDVLVRWGTLKQGDHVVAGPHYGRVRRMLNSEGKAVKSAPPGSPVRLVGLKGLPAPGTDVLAVPSDKRARRVAEARAQQLAMVAGARAEQWAVPDGVRKELIRRGRLIRNAVKHYESAVQERRERKERMRSGHATPEDLKEEEEERDYMLAHGLTDKDTPLDRHPMMEEPRRLPLVVKADMDGSLEALVQSLNAFPTDDVWVEVVRAGTGQVSKTDVEMAALSGATVVGFNVTVDHNANKLVKSSKVRVETHDIIYRVVDQVWDMMQGLMPHDSEEQRVGVMEVKELFDVSVKSKKRTVAGCYVLEGEIPRNAVFQLKRDGEVLARRLLAVDLRHYKESVARVGKGMECGIMLAGFADFKAGDELVAVNLGSRVREMESTKPFSKQQSL